MEFPRRAVISNVSDGLGYINNDNKYIGKAYNRCVEIVDTVCDGGLYLTNFYIPEYKDINNDYIRWGFLIVSLGNIELL